MSKGVLFFTCVICAATTAALFAQQSDASDQGQSGTWSRDSSRDIDRYGTDTSGRYRDRSTFRDEGSRGQYGYRGTEDMEEFDTSEQRGTRMQEEPWTRGQAYRDREMYGRGTGMREDWQRGRMGGQAGELRTGQRLAVIAQVTNENARIPGVNPDHQVAQLRTREGSTLFVDLGPSDQAQELGLSGNQTIFARGRLINIEGHPVVMAQEVAKVSQRMMIERPGAEQFSERQRQFRQQRDRELYGYTDQDSGGQMGMQQESRMRREYEPQQQERSRMGGQDQFQQQEPNRQYDIEGQDR